MEGSEDGYENFHNAAESSPLPEATTHGEVEVTATQYTSPTELWARMIGGGNVPVCPLNTETAWSSSGSTTCFSSKWETKRRRVVNDRREAHLQLRKAPSRPPPPLQTAHRHQNQSQVPEKWKRRTNIKSGTSPSSPKMISWSTSFGSRNTTESSCEAAASSWSTDTGISSCKSSSS